MGNFIKSGDIIVLDNIHKIYCGDCKDFNSFSFMENEKATMCFTSPPYNVNSMKYGNNLGGAKKYSDYNDSIDNFDYLDLLLKSSKNALEKSEYLFYNISHTIANKLSLIDYIYQMRDKYVDTMIWVKDTTMPNCLQPNVLNTDFEYIYIYSNREDNKMSRKIKIGKEFRGNVSNVIKCERNMKNEYANIHRALMPLTLCENIIKTFTNEQDIVLDCFSGLGTNLIACKLNNRIYRGIEISPYYCEQTIKRYLEYSMNNDVYIIRDNKKIEFNEFKEQIGYVSNLFDI